MKWMDRGNDHRLHGWRHGVPLAGAFAVAFRRSPPLERLAALAAACSATPHAYAMHACAALLGDNTEVSLYGRTRSLVATMPLVLPLAGTALCAGGLFRHARHEWVA